MNKEEKALADYLGRPVLEYGGLYYPDYDTAYAVISEREYINEVMDDTELIEQISFPDLSDDALADFLDRYGYISSLTFDNDEIKKSIKNKAKKSISEALKIYFADENILDWFKDIEGEVYNLKDFVKWIVDNYGLQRLHANSSYIKLADNLYAIEQTYDFSQPHNPICSNCAYFLEHDDYPDECSCRPDIEKIDLNMENCDFCSDHQESDFEYEIDDFEYDQNSCNKAESQKMRKIETVYRCKFCKEKSKYRLNRKCPDDKRRKCEWILVK